VDNFPNKKESEEMVKEKEKTKAEREKGEKKEKKMDYYRKIAIIVGVLYITATAAGLLSAFFIGSNLKEPLDLAKISDDENNMKISLAFYFVMGVAVAGIGIAIYPVLKKRNEVLALGYVSARIIEGVFFIVGVTCLLTLLTLSQEFVKAGALDDSFFQTEAIILQAQGHWANMLGELAFCLSALILYSLLYRTKLIPRWLSGWGFIGAVLWPIGSLSLLGSNSGFFYGPIFLNEMVLAIWLIAKGFNTSAIDSRLHD